MPASPIENSLEHHSENGVGPLSRFSLAKRLLERNSMGPGPSETSFNPDLELLIWKERPSYFQTGLNLEVLGPAARTVQGQGEL